MGRTALGMQAAAVTTVAANVVTSGKEATKKSGCLNATCRLLAQAVGCGGGDGQQNTIEGHTNVQMACLGGQINGNVIKTGGDQQGHALHVEGEVPSDLMNEDRTIRATNKNNEMRNEMKKESRGWNVENKEKGEVVLTLYRN